MSQGRLILLTIWCLSGAALAEGTRPYADPNAAAEWQGQRGETMLHEMAFRGDATGVRELISAGARVNARVKGGATPLHIAAYRGHARVVTLLIDAGARINAKTDTGITPLDWAERNGHREATAILIANGATRGKRIARVTREGIDPGRTTVRPPSASPTSTDGFRIQLAAVSSEDRAVAAWERFSKRHSDLLIGLHFLIETAEIGGRRYYRVQAGHLDRDRARSLCDRLRVAGQPCLVTLGRSN